MPRRRGKEQIMSEMIYLPVERLHPHPDNPRKDLGDLSELADSVKANGIFQNLTVVVDDPTNTISDFTVIIGHRRLAAAKLAGLSEVPCVIAEMTAKEQVQTMLLENMQRSDLTVYEQAQGFQMMLDLGATVEEISDKSGFSATTVRRRVKMMELDQKKLKEVADDGNRQIRLEDFDELTKIEDIKARNKALADIGTNNFKSTVSSAIRKQEGKKRKPLAMKWLKSVGAKEIKSNETYSRKYERLPGSWYIYFYEWDEKDMPDVSKLKDGLFYYLGYGDSFSLFTKAKKPAKEKKSKEQLEKERKIREAWKVVNDAAKAAYELRKGFIDGVAMGSKNKVDVLTGAVYASMLESIDYNSMDRDGISSILGDDSKHYDPKRMLKAWDAYAKVSPKDMPKLVYAFFGDDENETYTGRYGKSDYPKFERSAKMEMLYAWLCALGYTMSDEEIAMMNGTHEVFSDGEG